MVSGEWKMHWRECVRNNEGPAPRCGRMLQWLLCDWGRPRCWKSRV